MIRDREFEELKNLKLPRYDELPNFGIYLEQLVTIINDCLKTIIYDDKFITSSMINNYTKSGIMPSPVKKKYYREHIAYAVVITILKNTISIYDINKGIIHELKKQSIETRYDDFCDKFENMLKMVMEGIINKDSVGILDIKLDMKKSYGLTLAILSVITREITLKLMKNYEKINGGKNE